MEILLTQERNTHVVNTPPCCSNNSSSGCYRRQRIVTSPTVMMTQQASSCHLKTPIISTRDAVLPPKDFIDRNTPTKFAFRPIRPNHDEDDFDRPPPPSFLSSPNRNVSPIDDDDQTEELRGLDFVDDYSHYHSYDDDYSDDDDDDDDDASVISMETPSID